MMIMCPLCGEHFDVKPQVAKVSATEYGLTITFEDIHIRHMPCEARQGGQ